MKALEILAWPGVVLVVVLVALWMFKGAIDKFISRAKRIGKDGIEAFGVEAAQQPEASKVADDRSAVDEFMRAYDDVLLIEREQAIRDDLKQRNLVQPGEREKVLIRALAAQMLIAEWDQISFLMFRSQFNTLRFLNAYPETTPEVIRKAGYEKVIEKHENFDMSFEEWLEFLLNRRLIVEANGRYSITDYGRGFLKYMVGTGRPDPKVY
jgi:hypothetical protein